MRNIKQIIVNKTKFMIISLFLIGLVNKVVKKSIYERLCILQFLKEWKLFMVIK